MDPNTNPNINSIPVVPADLNIATPPVNVPVTPIQNNNQENTSGMGDQSVVPQEIKGWSWGAFLWNWIWGVGNNTWIALLTLLPFVNIIMTIVLGIKGREWAWKNKKWDSIEAFNKTQKNWVKWWLIIILPLTILWVLGIFATIILTAINPSEQINKAGDLRMRNTASEFLLASEQYYTNNAFFPWNIDANDNFSAYSSANLSQEIWLEKLVNSDLITQDAVEQLNTSDYQVKVNALMSVDGSKLDIYFCFQPRSPMYKTAAKSSCDNISNPAFKNQFCLPGSEYLCVPDLEDKIDFGQNM